MRTVEIFLDNILPEQQAAIGRLVCWNFEGFDHVSISVDNFARLPSDLVNMDLIANYTKTNLKTGFVIGAIWDKEMKDYSFHS